MIDRPDFDTIFMTLALHLAERSRCMRRHVGVVIAKDTRVVSTGYNGPPSGAPHCEDLYGKAGCPKTLGGTCSVAIHAEENAISYANKNGIQLKDAVLYTTLSPCLPCAKLIYTVGISQVVYLKSYAEYKQIHTEEGLNFLSQFNVKVQQYTESKLKIPPLV